MFSVVALYLTFVSFSSSVYAECPNGCNGRGRCVAYDMCICNRNWQGNDCTERVCPFGKAHVDSPKGDLDLSNDISGPDVKVVPNNEVYPYGTSEQYPDMMDSDLQPITNSAHSYMECSNKGTCNRETGACECFEGYDGVACQRASCPGFPAVCAGHGVCKSAKQLAQTEYGNVYSLWDSDVTMGCYCDPGYYGPDCSQRDCKYGVDPLYEDDVQVAKKGVYNFAVLTTGTSFTGDVAVGAGSGYWAIRFFDYFNDDWLTSAIPAGATCDEVIAALEGLPSRVIPKDSVTCMKTEFYEAGALNWNNSYVNTMGGNKLHTYSVFYKMASWVAITGGAAINPVPNSFVHGNDTYNQQDYQANWNLAPVFTGAIYRVKFNGNAGALQEPQIELYLDGRRPSLLSPDEHQIVTFVVSDGEMGESTDIVADHCDHVIVSVDMLTTYFEYATSSVDYVTLGGMDNDELERLKACLGDADGNADNNVERFNWDYGDHDYPHLIKLVRAQSTYEDSPYYAAIYWNDTESKFRFINPFVPPDRFEEDWYEIYTTKGTLARTSANASALFEYGSRHVVTTVTGYQTVDDSESGYDGDIACESSPSTSDVPNCLTYGDLFTILDPTHPVANSPYLNLYTAKRVWTTPTQYAVNSSSTGVANSIYQLSRGTHVIETDATLNWGGDDTHYSYNVYKFTPSSASSYNYFGPCSNRGYCNPDSGVCECFAGYTGDNCHVQETLAL